MDYFLAPNQPRRRAAARKKAEQVYGQVKEGKDFAALAKEYSEDPSAKDGGSLGTLKRGELTPEIEQAILRLQPGESSPPTRSRPPSCTCSRPSSTCSSWSSARSI